MTPEKGTANPAFVQEAILKGETFDATSGPGKAFLKPARRPSQEDNGRLFSGKSRSRQAKGPEADQGTAMHHRTIDVDPSARPRDAHKEREPPKLSELQTYNAGGNRPSSADRDERSLSPFKKLSASKANAQNERYS